MAESPSDQEARAKAEADAAARRVAARRNADRNAKMPREAVISLSIGVSILAGLLLLAGSTVIGRMFGGSDAPPEPTPKVAGPSAPSGGGDPDDPLIRRRRRAGEGGGGGGLAGAGDGGGEDVDPSAPVPPGALAVLRGLRAYLFQASHSPRNALDASENVDPNLFPPGSLDGASPDVLQNLRLGALRAARFPITGLRVVGQQRAIGGSVYEIEALSTDAQGNEVVSRSQVTVEPTSGGGYRLSQLQTFQPFDDSSDDKPGGAGSFDGSSSSPAPAGATGPPPGTPTSGVYRKIIPPTTGASAAGSNGGTDSSAPDNGFPYTIR